MTEIFHFQKAQPVWPTGAEKEMNRSFVFRAVLSGGKDAPEARLFVTGQSDYKIYINGTFFAAGPARAAHGFYRVDELDLTAALDRPENVVAIIVAGYNVNSFYLLDQPPFLAAEIAKSGKIVCATGTSPDDGFCAIPYEERLQRVQRYSFQRPFCEVYRISSPENSRTRAFMTDANYRDFTPAALSCAGEKQYLCRGVFYPDYAPAPAQRLLSSGTVSVSEKDSYYSDRSVTRIGAQLKGFTIPELEVFSAKEAQKLDFTVTDKTERTADSVSLPADAFALFDMGLNLSGFIELDVVAKENVDLYLLFDEILSGEDQDVDFLRMQCGNVVIWQLGKGTYRLDAFEPYTFRYLKIAALHGAIEIKNLRMRRLEYRKDKLHPRAKLEDPVLRRIYDAAIETFCQNAVDVYMDCPSRERAGWLCDSFFTSRVEYALTGGSDVEHNFIENYILPDSFKCLPRGMLPMCYPSDHYDGVFIPNWAMWLGIELEEYRFARHGDESLVEGARDRLYGLLSYFRRFENEDGLLEHLESWVFLEWSHSNDLTQDISYPTNMLYCGFKRALAHLYGDDGLALEADALAEVIRQQSYIPDRGFFCDNAVYGKDGVARLSHDCTESCQYYAFFFDIAAPDTYPQLWKTLVDDFGPRRKQENRHPDIAFANAFIGNYLRLELLFRHGYYDKVTENIRGYFDYMATRTGTLWEHDAEKASCDHGFASHVIYWLDHIFG